MQIARSASLTGRDPASPSEYTRTLRMPSSWHARMTRRAISPRLAMRTLFSGSGIAADHQHRLAVLDRLVVLDEDPRHHTGGGRLDVVHELHDLDDAQHRPDLHSAPDLDERGRARLGCGVEGADHGRTDEHLVRGERDVAARPARARGER